VELSLFLVILNIPFPIICIYCGIKRKVKETMLTGLVLHYCNPFWFPVLLLNGMQLLEVKLCRSCGDKIYAHYLYTLKGGQSER